MREVEALIQASSEPDVLVVGDLNARARSPSVQALYQDGGLLTLTGFGRTAPGSAGATSLRGGRPGWIDHVLARGAAAARFVPESARAHALGPEETDAWLHAVSDHVPVWATFRVDEAASPAPVASPSERPRGAGR